MKLRTTGAVLALVTMAAAWPALAQETVNKVSEADDWTTFEYPPVCTASVTSGCRASSDKPQECFAGSQPVSTQFFKNGSSVQASTGQAEVLILYRPSEGIVGQVSFTGGYAFGDGSKVRLEIGTNTFELFTQGEWAWASSADQDAAIVAAMRRGADGTMTGTSSRGTTVVQKFSLKGFTASVDEAQRRCN